MLEKADPATRFDDAMREWAARPPAATPLAAVARIRGRLSSRRPDRSALAGARLVAATVAVAVAVGIGLGRLWSPLSAPRETPEARTEELPPLPDNVMVFWLDPDTPVYFVTRPER